MKNDGFSGSIGRLSRAEASSLEDHPKSVELVAYQEGQLDEAREEQIQAHLALCPECAETILDLGNFPDIELRVSGHERSEADQEADWTAIEARLGKELPEDRHVAPSFAQKTSKHTSSRLLLSAQPRPSLWLKAAAAVFLVTTLGLLTQIFLKPDPGGKMLEAPKVNIYFEELTPMDEAGTRSGTSVRISLPAEASSLVLILTTEDLREHATYEALIAGGTEGKSWRLKGLTQARDGSFSVDLPRALLSTGSYRLELSALQGGTPVQVARYQFDLELE